MTGDNKRMKNEESPLQTKLYTMAYKQSKARREAYKAKQEKEGKKVVKWIFAVLVLLAILFMVYSVYITM